MASNNRKTKRKTLPDTDLATNDHHQNVYVQILWDKQPIQTMPSALQDMQSVWKEKPLQSNMQKHTETDRDTSNSRFRILHQMEKNVTGGDGHIGLANIKSLNFNSLTGICYRIESKTIEINQKTYEIDTGNDNSLMLFNILQILFPTAAM